MRPSRAAARTGAGTAALANRRAGWMEQAEVAGVVQHQTQVLIRHA